MFGNFVNLLIINKLTKLYAAIFYLYLLIITTLFYCETLRSNIFRIFCCFDQSRLVVLFNGFQKKTQKTPKSEIEKAEKLKAEYFEQKIKLKENEPKK